jgi:hypothetical protein
MHDERLAGIQIAHDVNGVVQMIIVVVRYQNGVDRRKLGNGQQWRYSPGLGPEYGAGVVAKVRVEQDVLVADLEQHPHITEPGDQRQSVALCNERVIHVATPFFGECRIAALGFGCWREIPANPAKQDFVPRDMAGRDRGIDIDKTVRPLMRFLSVEAGVMADSAVQRDHDE